MDTSSDTPTNNVSEFLWRDVLSNDDEWIQNYLTVNDGFDFTYLYGGLSAIAAHYFGNRGKTNVFIHEVNLNDNKVNALTRIPRFNVRHRYIVTLKFVKGNDLRNAAVYINPSSRKTKFEYFIPHNDTNRQEIKQAMTRYLEFLTQSWMRELELSRDNMYCSGIYFPKTIRGANNYLPFFYVQRMERDDYNNRLLFKTDNPDMDRVTRAKINAWKALMNFATTCAERDRNFNIRTNLNVTRDTFEFLNDLKPCTTTNKQEDAAVASNELSGFIPTKDAREPLWFGRRV